MIQPASLSFLLWLFSLFLFCLLLGTVAVMAGVGGGVLFVPLVSALFPIHLDLVRGAGLLVALAGSVAAAPRLIEKRLSSVRLAVPFSLAGSVGAVFGAIVGLAMDGPTVRVLLGVFMLAVAALTTLRRGAQPNVATGLGEPASPDGASHRTSEQVKEIDPPRWRLGHMSDVYRNESTGYNERWEARRVLPATLFFIVIGFIGGVFGVGAGWANVPVLTMMVGLPLRIAAATSGLIIAVNSSAAAWVYLQRGAVDALVVLPAILGITLGTRIGTGLLERAKPEMIRLVVVVVLVVAGIRTLIGG